MEHTDISKADSSKKSYSLIIGWLYPDLMSTYGDRGNIICLQKRCECRGIKVTVQNISLSTPVSILETCDLLVMGGAQDSQQRIISRGLTEQTGLTLHKMTEIGIPGLYICGAYQLLGNYYKDAEGSVLEGLGIFDLHTENPGKSHKRLTGNVTGRLNEELFPDCPNSLLVGFENHGGRTYLGKNIKPLCTITKGYGNNGVDGTEGAVYRNSIGSYFHGPLLPKNPFLADFLIQKALEKKYGCPVKLAKIDDTLSHETDRGTA